MGTGFHDLKVWRDAKALAVTTYRLTTHLKDFRPCLQNPSSCHSERSEESNWTLAPLPRRVTAAGFFALLRMTNHLKTRPSLRDQIRRAAVSVPSNIAEGDERDTDKDSVRFFYIAKGSLAELRTQVEIAVEVGLITSSEAAPVLTSAATLGRRLGALIKSRAHVA